MKTTLIYLVDGTNQLGYRPNKWNHQIGDKITTQDGKKQCTIIRVIECSVENIQLLNKILDTVSKFNRGVAITKTVSIYGLKIRQTIGEKRWKSDEARMNFITTALEIFN